MTPDRFVRCAYCGRLLAELLTRPWKIKCNRCKATNARTAADQKKLDDR